MTMSITVCSCSERPLSLLVDYPSNTPRANHIAYTIANWDKSIVGNLGKAWER
jgi:hypothetical protein